MQRGLREETSLRIVTETSVRGSWFGIIQHVKTKCEPHTRQLPERRSTDQLVPAMSQAAERKRVLYFHDEGIALYASVEASLVKPQTARLAHELISAYGLQQHMTVCLCNKNWMPLPPAEFTKFHTDAYVKFLQQAHLSSHSSLLPPTRVRPRSCASRSRRTLTRARAPQLEHNGIDVIDEVSGYVLNGSVCFSETAWPFSQSYAGGSVAAAQSLSQGVADVAIHLAGGQNHARRDCASGFSYVNDSVLATLALLKTHERVLFVSLDAHHASGVEEAFYATDKVLVVSLHRYREGFFPGSGGAKDAGEGAGKHHTINLPLSDGLTGDGLVGVFAPVVDAAVARFQPHAIVCCAGTGMLSGDRLGCMNVPLESHTRCVQALLAHERPLLLLGGGGYSQCNAARAWCHMTAAACQVEVADELPEHDCYAYYSPTYRLEVAAAVMEDCNTEASLAAVREGALRTVEQIPAHTKPEPRKPDAPQEPDVEMAPAAADGEGQAADKEVKEEANEDAGSDAPPAAADGAPDVKAEPAGAAPDATATGAPDAAGEAEPMQTDARDAFGEPNPAND